MFQEGAVRPEFADAKLEVLLSNGSFGATTISYPLANIASASVSNDVRRVSVSIPLRANPSQFPNDSYSLDLTLIVSLPPGLTLQLPQGVTHSDRHLPAVFNVAVDGRLGQWTVGKTHSAPIKYPNGASVSQITGISVQFSRNWTYSAFVYAVSLMPAVIGLSFFVRTRRPRGASDTSGAMELAAALLALIALRQVFVPTDITGLTRLDFVLGVQLLAVCWLMAVTYVAEPPASPPPPARRPPPRRRRLAPQIPNGAVRRVT